MLKTGELLMLSTESYSDKEYNGPYEVLKPFDIYAVAQEVQDAPKRSEHYEWQKKNGPDDVIDYLKANHFIKEIPCHTFHLGCYGDINVTPEKENV